MNTLRRAVSKPQVGGTVRSVTNLTHQDVREFLEVTAEIPVEVEVEIFPLREANEALKRLKGGEIEGAAVLIP